MALRYLTDNVVREHPYCSDIETLTILLIESEPLYHVQLSSAGQQTAEPQQSTDNTLILRSHTLLFYYARTTFILSYYAFILCSHTMNSYPAILDSYFDTALSNYALILRSQLHSYYVLILHTYYVFILCSQTTHILRSHTILIVSSY